jgi:hypothetical protein
MKMKQARANRTKQPCGGKTRYASKEKALEMMGLLQEMRALGERTESRAYFCEKCDGWHLTSRRRRIR